MLCKTYESPTTLKLMVTWSLKGDSKGGSQDNNCSQKIKINLRLSGNGRTEKMWNVKLDLCNLMKTYENYYLTEGKKKKKDQSGNVLENNRKIWLEDREISIKA